MVELAAEIASAVHTREVAKDGVYAKIADLNSQIEGLSDQLVMITDQLQEQADIVAVSSDMFEAASLRGDEHAPPADGKADRTGDGDRKGASELKAAADRLRQAATS